MATTVPDGIWTPDSSDPYALTIDLATMADTIQDGLDTVRGEASSALIARTPAATTSVSGLVELATNAETQTGTDTTRAVTPAALTARTATTGRRGVAELATQAEVNAGTDNTRIVTPATLRGKVNNVLWTGASYMNGSQTVPLSQNVSAQVSGVVLAWSAYVSGVAQNYNWHYTFIPKWAVATNPGAGMVDGWSYGASSGGSPTLITKYIYVSDGHLSGHASNDQAPNNQVVLRAVIGV